MHFYCHFHIQRTTYVVGLLRRQLRRPTVVRALAKHVGPTSTTLRVRLAVGLKVEVKRLLELQSHFKSVFIHYMYTNL